MNNKQQIQAAIGMQERTESWPLAAEPAAFLLVPVARETVNSERSASIIKTQEGMGRDARWEIKRSVCEPTRFIIYFEKQDGLVSLRVASLELLEKVTCHRFSHGTT